MSTALKPKPSGKVMQTLTVPDCATVSSKCSQMELIESYGWSGQAVGLVPTGHGFMGVGFGSMGLQSPVVGDVVGLRPPVGMQKIEDGFPPFNASQFGAVKRIGLFPDVGTVPDGGVVALATPGSRPTPRRINRITAARSCRLRKKTRPMRALPYAAVTKRSTRLRPWLPLCPMAEPAL